jgi:hypothetical protein
MCLNSATIGVSQEFKQWKSYLLIEPFAVSLIYTFNRHIFVCICRVATDYKSVVAITAHESAKIIEYLRISSKSDIVSQTAA